MNKCRMPKCNREVVTRGLCDACYRSTKRLIALGKTTWERLEADGLAEAPRQGGKPRTPAYEAIVGDE